MSTQEKLRQIVAEQLGTDAEEIGVQDDLQEDLFADSIDMVEIMQKVEEEFGVSLTDEGVQDLHTIRQIARYLDALQKNA